MTTAAAAGPLNDRAGRAAVAAWTAAFAGLRRWHRYQVHGLDTLLGAEPFLVVGYHGRPIAHDLILLQEAIHARKGYRPHAIVHRTLYEHPLSAPLFQGLGMLPGDGPELDAAVARGEHIIVTPGGTREGLRSVRHRHRVCWGQRVGYLRLALRLGLRIVPVAAHGTDHAFLGLNDGEATARRLRLPPGYPAWLGLGLGGVWPLALPFPARFRQIVGAPIDPAAGGLTAAADRQALLPLHAQVMAAVQALLDGAR
ncbi:MAG: acyltransferase [Myxococcales bacterium]|nr:acyltransferase [Myxococcales bacterium]